MEDLGKGNMLDGSKQGQVLGLSNEVVDSLRAAEAFKPTQGWSLFRRPATLIRKETLQMAKYMGQVKPGERVKTIRKVIHGERSSGKSVLALQAMAMAFLKEWVVIHVPEGQCLEFVYPLECTDAVCSSGCDYWSYSIRALY